MDYMKELNVAITVCDKEGKILQMNDKSQKTNHGDLVGQNVLDCHPEPARTKLVQLMEEHATNAYTIEKIDLPDPVVREWRVYGVGGIFFGDSF